MSSAGAAQGRIWATVFWTPPASSPCPGARLPKGWVKYFEKRDFLAGSFMWTGFDYRGEPNPFVTTNVCSSFGAIDLCGMENRPSTIIKRGGRTSRY